jgi:hypothetical protein
MLLSIHGTIQVITCKGLRLGTIHKNESYATENNKVEGEGRVRRRMVWILKFKGDY